jgi:O-antigen ligase
VIALYALQALYSEDFSKALQNSAFFHVPFALAFALLADCRWDRQLLKGTALVIGAEALVFALVGFWEYGARELLWNDEVIRSNDFHTYFRVNSLFWDPNVFGRYMAIVITALMAVLLWSRNSRVAVWLGALCGVLWLGMVITFSQSSFAALLAGLAVLAALRWSLRWTVVICVAGLIAVAGFVLAAGGSLKIDLSTGHKLNEDVSGRGNLISGGIDLFGDRPLWGYGAGSFSEAFQEHQTDGRAHVNESHTEPVTIAAEQGLIGLAAYFALLGAAFATLLRGMRRAMPGPRDPPSVTGLAAERPDAEPAARAAILACLVALLVHSMAYAGFLEDPLTWALLSIGACLAVAASPQRDPRPRPHGGEATPTPPAPASA